MMLQFTNGFSAQLNPPTHDNQEGLQLVAIPNDETTAERLAGWNIDKPIYSRMARWENRFQKSAQEAFQSIETAQEAFDRMKALVKAWNRPELNVSTYIHGRTGGRPDLDQATITIWKGSRRLIAFAQKDRWHLAKQLADR